MERISCIAAGILFFLGVFVFAARTDAVSTKRAGVISCGPVPATSDHSTWPKDNNSGNGCTHQPVSAALLGRGKRGKIHVC